MSHRNVRTSAYSGRGSLLRLERNIDGGTSDTTSEHSISIFELTKTKGSGLGRVATGHTRLLERGRMHRRRRIPAHQATLCPPRWLWVLALLSPLHPLLQPQDKVQISSCVLSFFFVLGGRGGVRAGVVGVGRCVHANVHVVSQVKYIVCTTMLHEDTHMYR